MPESERNEGESPKRDSYLLREETLSSSDDDEFDHEAHVDTLEDIIHHTTTPWHIGLYGTWGSGKTTIVDLLYKRIRASQSKQDDGLKSTDEGESEPDPRHDHEDVICASIDAWKHAEDSVRTELLLDLNRSLAENLHKRFPDADFRIDDTQGGRSSNEGNSGEQGETTRNLTHRQYGLLSTDTIISRLYDVEEQKQETTRGIWETVKRLNSRTWIPVVALLAIWGILQTVSWQLWLASYRIPIRPIVEIVGITVGLTIFLNLATDDLNRARTQIQRTVANPQKDWSGAYENLFRSILNEAEKEYREHSDQEDCDPTFVITIDDIDRCENETAYEILIALKSFLAVNGCIYIIPCDQDALLDHLASVDDSHYLQGVANQQDFLAKLIDTELGVTDPVPSQLEGFLNTQIDKLQHDFDTETLKVIRQANFRTPRRITRVLNRLVVLTELATSRESTHLDTAESPTRSWRSSSSSTDSTSGADKKAVADGSTGEATDWKMPLLGVVAVLQEAYPKFYAGLVDDPYRLTEIYGQLETGFTEASHKGLDSFFDDFSVPDENRDRLTAFLSETVELGQGAADLEPYIRLGGSPLTAINTFATRLEEGRVEALRTLLRQHELQTKGILERFGNVQDPPQDQHLNTRGNSPALSYVEVIENQLIQGKTNQAAVRAALELGEDFSSEDRERIATAVLEALEQHTGDIQIFQDLTPGTLAPYLEVLETREQRVTLVKQYLMGVFTEGGISEKRLEQMVDQYGDQLADEDIQTAFRETINSAYHEGNIERDELLTMIDTVKNTAPQLYTPELIEVR